MYNSEFSIQNAVTCLKQMRWQCLGNSARSK